MVRFWQLTLRKFSRFDNNYGNNGTHRRDHGQRHDDDNLQGHAKSQTTITRRNNSWCGGVREDNLLKKIVLLMVGDSCSSSSSYTLLSFNTTMQIAYGQLLQNTAIARDDPQQ
jgi:hypothetical protein